MSKLMIAMPSDKTPPLYDFFNDELNEKQRQKLLSLFALMLQAPVSVMREPYRHPLLDALARISAEEYPAKEWLEAMGYLLVPMQEDGRHPV